MTNFTLPFILANLQLIGKLMLLFSSLSTVPENPFEPDLEEIRKKRLAKLSKK